MKRFQAVEQRSCLYLKADDSNLLLRVSVISVSKSENTEANMKINSSRPIEGLAPLMGHNPYCQHHVRKTTMENYGSVSTPKTVLTPRIVVGRTVVYYMKLKSFQALYSIDADRGLQFL